VVRFYGSSLDALIDRGSDAEAAEMLSTAGIGARILWHFSNPWAGRIEAFVPGQVVKFHELSLQSIANPIAKALAKLHLHATHQQQAAATPDRLSLRICGSTSTLL